MKILAVSDAQHWNDFERVLKKQKPEIVFFIGDLVNDGHSSYHSPSVSWIESELIKNPNKSVADMLFYEEPRGKYKKTRYFVKERKIHAEGFYDALKKASRVAKRVFVIKGNHDDKNYSIKKISNIPKCEEISGKLVEYKGLKILGLAYTDCHYLKKLKPLLEMHKPDIIVSHAEKKRWDLLIKTKTKIIINGHYKERNLKRKKPTLFFSTGCYPNYLTINYNKKISSKNFIPTPQMKTFYYERGGYAKITIPKVKSWKAEKII